LVTTKCLFRLLNPIAKKVYSALIIYYLNFAVIYKLGMSSEFQLNFFKQI